MLQDLSIEFLELPDKEVESPDKEDSNRMQEPHSEPKVCYVAEFLDLCLQVFIFSNCDRSRVLKNLCLDVSRSYITHVHRIRSSESDPTRATYT